MKARKQNILLQMLPLPLVLLFFAFFFAAFSPAPVLAQTREVVMGWQSSPVPGYTLDYLYFTGNSLRFGVEKTSKYFEFGDANFFDFVLMRRYTEKIEMPDTFYVTLRVNHAEVKDAENSGFREIVLKLAFQNGDHYIYPITFAYIAAEKVSSPFYIEKFQVYKIGIRKEFREHFPELDMLQLQPSILIDKSASVLASAEVEFQKLVFQYEDGREVVMEDFTLASAMRGEKIPSNFSLEQNYPNPFNPTTTIQFTLPEAGKFNLKVYNILGQEVAELLDGELEAGIYKVNFDASKLASGVYVYKLVGNNASTSKKMVLVK